MQRLRSTLDRIDRKGYGAYKDLSGSHDFGPFVLFVDRVQADPFAPPSLIRIRTKVNSFDPALFESPVRSVAFEDFLTRSVEREIRRTVRGNRGSGGSGRVEIQHASQVVLPRTSMVVEPGYVEARMAAGLPAGAEASTPARPKQCCSKNCPRSYVGVSFQLLRGRRYRGARLHVETVEDADHLRGLLPGLGLVAFVADGAVLPRESGASDRPLREGAVPFESPVEYRVEVELPNGASFRGWGFPRASRSWPGAGSTARARCSRRSRGESTIMCRVTAGSWSWRGGCGQDQDRGRQERLGVDISAMIGDLPGRPEHKDFSTPNASGSTSQAANIAEAIEVGTSLLLVDEDTSATNFMIRDERMRELVRREPISPFIDLVRPLHRSLGISTVVVVGGVGDYLDVADRVILLEDYAPSDATSRSREVTERFPPRAR